MIVYTFLFFFSFFETSICRELCHPFSFLYTSALVSSSLLKVDKTIPWAYFIAFTYTWRKEKKKNPIGFHINRVRACRDIYADGRRWLNERALRLVDFEWRHEHNWSTHGGAFNSFSSRNLGTPHRSSRQGLEQCICIVVWRQKFFVTRRAPVIHK